MAALQRLSYWSIILDVITGGQVTVTAPPSNAQSNVSLSIPAAAPSDAVAVPGNFVSLSIEQDRWTDWVGDTSRNKFFYNLLDNINQLTGVPPNIRLGGDSEDHTSYDPSLKYENSVFPPDTANSPYPEGNVTIGKQFYDTVAFLPTGTHMTIGLNLASNNTATIVSQAKAIQSAFSSKAVKKAQITLDLIEVGNEADLYAKHYLRVSTFDVMAYVSQWSDFANAVVPYIGSGTKIQACAFAESSHTMTGFSPQSILANGILNSPAGGMIGTISQHHYSGTTCEGGGALLPDLMNKATIRSNLTVFSPDIAAARAKGLTYVLGETNSYSCHGAPGVSNTAGAALWLIDYALHASQIGIARLYFHNGVGFRYNLIQPVPLTRAILDGTLLSLPLPPHVQPAYYGWVVVAEALGASGQATVKEIDDLDGSEWLTGYAVYEGGVLRRAVLVNSRTYLSTTGGERNAIHVTLDAQGGKGTGLMSVKRLTIGFADDESGLTWGGQTYENSTTHGLVAGVEDAQTRPVSWGVDIQDTEAVLLTFF